MYGDFYEFWRDQIESVVDNEVPTEDIEAEHVGGEIYEVTAKYYDEDKGQNMLFEGRYDDWAGRWLDKFVRRGDSLKNDGFGGLELKLKAPVKGAPQARGDNDPYGLPPYELPPGFIEPQYGHKSYDVIGERSKIFEIIKTQPEFRLRGPVKHMDVPGGYYSSKSQVVMMKIYRVKKPSDYQIFEVEGYNTSPDEPGVQKKWFYKIKSVTGTK